MVSPASEGGFPPRATRGPSSPQTQGRPNLASLPAALASSLQLLGAGLRVSAPPPSLLQQSVAPTETELSKRLWMRDQVVGLKLVLSVFGVLVSGVLICLWKGILICALD